MTSKRGNKITEQHIEGYTGSIIEHNEKQFADDHQRLLRAFYASVSKESGITITTTTALSSEQQ